MAAAGELVNRARAHIRSAELIADVDPTLAITACHESARQAITAHMRAPGYQPTGSLGAHRLVLDYAERALGGKIEASDLRALDYLRRDRHTADYGDFATRKLGPSHASDAIGLVSRVLAAVAADLAASTKD